MKLKNKLNLSFSKHVQYHLENDLNIFNSVYRLHSPAFYEFLEDVRTMAKANLVELTEDEKFYLFALETGKKAVYKSRGGRYVEVVLDSPMLAGARDDSKYIVYRRHPDNKKTEDGQIISVKIGFGVKGPRIPNCSETRRKAFLARQQCDQKTLEKDGYKPGRRICNIHRWRKQLKLECDKPW